MKHYLVISSDTCPYCVKVKDAITAAGHQYVDLNLNQVPEVGDVLRKLGVKTVPQVFEYVGNCDETVARLGAA